MQHLSLSRTVVAAALIAMGGMVASLGYAAGAGSTDTSTATGTKAATSDTSKGQTGNALKAGDRKFVTKAAEGGIAEVQLGKLAQQKASNDQVKQFGQRMVTDHGSANEKLKAVASGKGISLPAQMDTSAQKEYDKLSKLSGVQFDRAYIAAMVSDHKKDVSEFRSESRSGSDNDLKSFAASTLPTLEQHLQMAQSAQHAVKQSATGHKSPSGASTSQGSSRS